MHLDVVRVGFGSAISEQNIAWEITRLSFMSQKGGQLGKPIDLHMSPSLKQSPSKNEIILSLSLEVPENKSLSQNRVNCVPLFKW